MIKIRTHKCKAVLLTALLLILQIPLSAAAKGSTSTPKQKMTQSTFENPDFAFPQTVEKDASAQFSVALDERDGVKALKAAIQMVVARQQVSQSSLKPTCR